MLYFCKAARQEDCRAMLPGNCTIAMVQYAESMVKLAKTAVYEQNLHNNNKNNKACTHVRKYKRG
jgi:hypothetical protein